MDYVYHKSSYDAGLVSVRKLITSNQIKLSHMTKHMHFPDKKSEVELEIVFNHNDYDNLFFLCKYRDTINTIISKYSMFRFAFTKIDYNSLLFHNSISLRFLLDFEKQKIVLRKRGMSDQELFLLHYLQHIELIQICMSIYNDYVRKDDERKWYPLKNTFALLSSHRAIALDSLAADVSVMRDDVKSTILAKDTAKADPKIGYQLCFSKIMHHIKYAQKQCSRDMQSCINQVMDSNDYIASLNTTLLDYL